MDKAKDYTVVDCSVGHQAQGQVIAGGNDRMPGGMRRADEANRQSEPSRLFRPTYRENHDAAVAIAEIKEKAEELARLIAAIPDGPRGVLVDQHASPADIVLAQVDSRGANRTIALRHLEDCVMRAVKAVTT